MAPESTELTPAAIPLTTELSRLLPHRSRMEGAGHNTSTANVKERGKGPSSPDPSVDPYSYPRLRPPGKTALLLPPRPPAHVDPIEWREVELPGAQP